MAGKEKQTPKDAPKAARAAKLAQSLKANLARRKAAKGQKPAEAAPKDQG